MNEERQSVAHWLKDQTFNRTRYGDGPLPCMVSPSPQLLEQMKADLERLRSTAKGVVPHLLKIRGSSPPGFNDGLIYPGDLYPLGTTARDVRRAAADKAPLRGAIRAIVILVQFSDELMTETKQHFEELFFSTGVLSNGSVREYYREVSNNLVDVIGEVVGPYTLPLTLSEYAHGESGTGMTQPNARTMAKDAVTAANPDVNFSMYDNDGDGYVDALIILHAGAGAETTGDPDQIWSHKWVLPSTFSADGVNLYAYLTVPEDSKIGVCCHELGHLLFGFPDLYDVDYSSEGVGSWCLMGGGSWNGGGDIPAHPSAWCKLDQGWATMVNPSVNGPASIDAVETSHTIYRLWKNGAASKEYFLVENRQKLLYDRALPGNGLLIWHIDDAIANNSDENHYKVALVQADSLKQLEGGVNRGDGGDPYPGSTNNRKIDSSSTPSSKSYGNVETCVYVTNIPDSSPNMQVTIGVQCIIKRKEKDKELRKEIIKEYRKETYKELYSEKSMIRDNKNIRDGLKQNKEIDKYKDTEGRPGTLIPSNLGPSSCDDLEQRVMDLEARVDQIEPFIDQSLRPDMKESALYSEVDVQEMRRRLMRRPDLSRR